MEYLHCRFGEITDCVFENMNDDGIDQNHCYHTLIANNEFYNVKDKALELGSESFGSSDSLFVINNLFVQCRVAINVKESSYAKIENATFYQNEISLDVFTSPDSTTISSAEMFSSIIVESDLDVSSNPRSETSISFCSSENELNYGPTNTHGDILLTDPQNRDFSIQEAVFPEGYSRENFGYQRK